MMHACIAHASAAYHVPVAAVRKVLSERGNGVGPMAIPAQWLPVLARAGFSIPKVRHDRCMNIAAGAWILAFERRLHGHKTPAPATGRAQSPTDKNGAGKPPTKSCIEAAAHHYHVSLTLFRGVLRTEDGHVGQIHHNRNGSIDIGPAQINSIWLPTLRKHGITKHMLLTDGCLNVRVGAWILARAMQGADPRKPAQFWQHVGDYNSHTPRYNKRYAAMVWRHLPAAP